MYDIFVKELISDGKLNVLVPWYLMSSYMYYHTTADEQILSDEVFDLMCKTLLDSFEQVTHQHKHLVDVGSLKAGTGFNLDFKNIPTIIKVSAWELYDNKTMSKL